MLFLCGVFVLSSIYGKQLAYFSGLYDSLLKGRIEVQKILTAANQLPQPDNWNGFVESAGEQYAQGIKEGKEWCTFRIFLSITFSWAYLPEFLLALSSKSVWQLLFP